MSEQTKLKPIAAALGTTFALSLSLSPVANAADNPFSVTELSQGGYMVADAHGGEGKCGEGKCGEGKCGEGKCGEGKCGDDKAEGEGKCGEGKCGEGKCGDDKAEGEGKCGEGKCGDAG